MSQFFCNFAAEFVSTPKISFSGAKIRQNFEIYKYNREKRKNICYFSPTDSVQHGCQCPGEELCRSLGRSRRMVAFAKGE